MSLTKVECWQMKCDGCGEDWAGDFVPHFQSVEAALGNLHDWSGTAEGDKHYCEDCRPLTQRESHGRRFLGR